MNQSLFYLSHDPVNEHYIRCWVEERGGTLCPLSLRDVLPDGECQLLIVDGDSLDTDGREAYLAGLLAQSGSWRMGLHSYYLPDAETMRLTGMVVFPRLDPDTTTWLANHYRCYFSGPVPLRPRAVSFLSARFLAAKIRSDCRP